MRRRTVLGVLALVLLAGAYGAREVLNRLGGPRVPVEVSAERGATATARTETPIDVVQPAAPDVEPETVPRARIAFEQAAAPEPRARSRERRASSAEPLTESASITGRVSTPSGIALRDVMVSAAPDSRTKGTKLWTRTDGDGRFEFEVPARFDLVYRIQVAGTSEDRTLRRLIQTMKGQGGLRRDEVPPGQEGVDFVIPVPGSLTLIAIDARNGNAIGFSVQWRHEDEEEFKDYGWGGQRFRPNEKGQITIGFPAGPIVLRLSEPGYTPLERAFVVPPTTSALPEVVEFEPSARVEMTLLMEPGTTPRDFNSNLGQFVPKDDRGRPRYVAQVMLLTAEEHERYLNAKRRDVDNLWRENLMGPLHREGRVFEDEDGTWTAWPQPGTYHLAAFPRETSFDPPTVVVGTKDISFGAVARPRSSKQR